MCVDYDINNLGTPPSAQRGGWAAGMATSVHSEFITRTHTVSFTGFKCKHPLTKSRRLLRSIFREGNLISRPARH